MCETEEACLNHEVTCEGGSVSEQRRQCGECGTLQSRSNIARHVRGVEGDGRAIVGIMVRKRRQRRQGDGPEGG